jgi:S-(hydroxymethyl)glutathione dehydrogenase/alcohol dehydrogenase
MNTRAAVLWERGQPLSVEEVELAPPGPGEVLVEIKAAGVCHSDLHPAQDDWPIRTPIVLGHEGAGIVREVGSDVSHLKPGDHVVLCWAPACGTCPCCRDGRAVLCERLDRTTFRNKLPSGATKLRARGQELAHFLGTACFAQHAVIPQEGAVPVPADVPFDALATVGCAVVTGVGAVTTAARATSGASVVIIGAGGVGLNVAQGAAITGCEPIIAIDRRPAPLAIARAFGATHTVQAGSDLDFRPRDDSGQKSRSDPTVDAVRELTAGRGADFVFDTVGTPQTLADALAATRKGGTVVLTGLSRVDAIGAVQMFPFVMQEKRLVGSAYGSGRPAEDIRRLVEWFRSGRLKLRELVGRTYSLDQVNDALSALAASEGARGVILL